MTASSLARTNVAFVGLGVQGAPLARNLLDAGAKLTVVDALPERATQLAAAGAAVETTPLECAADADFVFLCVANDEQLLDAVMGDEGVLRSMRPGTVMVINSTVHPKNVIQIGERAAELDVEVIDAPLTGGAAGAKARTVLYFVGGSDRAVSACEELLQISASKIIRCGELGSGTQAKLVHQFLLCGNLAVAHHAWVFARSAGLHSDLVAQIIRDGAGQSRMAERYPDLSPDSHSISLWLKDVRLFEDLGGDFGISLHKYQWIADAISTIHPDLSLANGQENDHKI